jgi:hypothetical protein
MTIDLERGAFESEATAAMRDAFKAACEEIRDIARSGQLPI